MALWAVDAMLEGWLFIRYDFMHMNIHGNHACTHIPWLLSCMGSLGHTSFFCVRVCNNWLIFGKQKRGSYTCMLHAYIMLNDHAI